MLNIKSISTLAVLSFITLMFSGCATQVTEKPNAVVRSQVPFDEYKSVILVRTEIAPKYADHKANIKATKKIDSILEDRLKGIFKNLKIMTAKELAAQNFEGQSAKDTLLIKPKIKQIKFIGGAARFWAGALAGSSVVIIDTAFEEASTSKIIANPGFYRKAGAYTDAFGVASNRMLDDAAQDIVNYTAANK